MLPVRTKSFISRSSLFGINLWLTSSNVPSIFYANIYLIIIFLFADFFDKILIRSKNTFIGYFKNKVTFPFKQLRLQMGYCTLQNNNFYKLTTRLIHYEKVATQDKFRIWLFKSIQYFKIIFCKYASIRFFSVKLCVRAIFTKQTLFLLRI